MNYPNPDARSAANRVAVALASLWLAWVMLSHVGIRNGWSSIGGSVDGFTVWDWLLLLWLVVLRPTLNRRLTPRLVLPGEDLRPPGFGWRALAFLGVLGTTLLTLVVTVPLFGLIFREGNWADWTSGFGRFLTDSAFVVPMALIAAFLFLSPVIWPSEAWARRARVRLSGGRPGGRRRSVRA
ncbi:hypothetical protein [Streptomyces sp. NPDC093109]|uniref:hypothetical protein n=1 Tax=Streptomyces sp. NPDC093109 TaxID=3154977 RepID=UPI00344EA13B